MNAKVFLIRSVAVVAMACCLVSFLRYSLSAIFVGGFHGDDESTWIDGSLVMLALGCAATAVAFTEVCARIPRMKLFSTARAKPSRLRAAGAYTVETIQPKFGM